MKKYTAALALIAGVITSSVYAEPIEGELNITWGAEIPSVGGGTFSVGDSSGTALNSSSLVALVAYAPTFQINDYVTDASTLFQNFVLIGTVPVTYAEGGSYPDGFFQSSTENYNVDTAGIENYLVCYWVLNNVTSYDINSVIDCSEYAILSSSSWTSVPAGNDGLQTNNPEYLIRTTSLTPIYGGTESGAGFNGGDMYTTQAVPEPAFYAAGVGVIALLVVQLRRRRKAA